MTSTATQWPIPVVGLRTLCDLKTSSTVTLEVWNPQRAYLPVRYPAFSSRGNTTLWLVQAAHLVPERGNMSRQQHMGALRQMPASAEGPPSHTLMLFAQPGSFSITKHTTRNDLQYSCNQCSFDSAVAACAAKNKTAHLGLCTA
jgi:hypothetical protein